MLAEASGVNRLVRACEASTMTALAAWLDPFFLDTAVSSETVSAWRGNEPQVSADWRKQKISCAWRRGWMPISRGYGSETIPGLAW